MIDFAKFKKYKLSEREAIIVFTILDDTKSNTKKMVSMLKPNENDLNSLKEKEVIKNDSTLENLSFTNSFLGKNRNYFNEFNSIYPSYVIRPDGNKDYLKTCLKRCELAYNSRIQSDMEHEDAIKGLRKNISLFTQTDRMKFFKRMINYIRDEEWVAYVDGEMEEDSDNAIKYGEEIE